MRIARGTLGMSALFVALSGCIEAAPATQTARPQDTKREISADQCGGIAWRGGDADTTVCPGVRGCQCAHPQVCCVVALDSSNGSCSTLRGCRDLALECDGSEDCAMQGKVCCLEDRLGGGSSCRAAQDCAQSGGTKLCRTDDDCDSGARCLPVASGPLRGIVAMCRR